MRTFGPKKALAVAAAALLGALPLNAIDGADSGRNSPGNLLSKSVALLPDGITLSPSVTLLDGTAHEYVFYDDKLLSELIWDMKPLIMYGAVLGLSWDRGLELSIDGSAAFPGKTGDIVDLDWKNVPINGTQGLTHFATGAADLQYAYEAAAGARWRFVLPRPFTGVRSLALLPGLGFRYMIRGWDCRDGYAQYPAGTEIDGLYRIWTSDAQKAAIVGVPISYLQEWWMPELSLAADARITDRFSFEVTARGSPWAFCNGVDYHFIGTDLGTVWVFGGAPWTLYFDQLSGGWLLEGGVTATVRATNWLSFRIGWSKTWTSIIRGDTYKKASASTVVTVAKESDGMGGGAKLDYQSVTCAAVFRLR